ncbi:glutamate--tRNA ligase [Cesiribacter andamanensis]|uniref:Glutamate--tRNA ligase n=1 Tax=Cesiribacter andamanensis AMV16 TaxID=1279009 RepID=M7NVK3_9BACT|nr:glutamate--tRNA ligase [Cesiribacter andamanensis]EMR02509.1 Glutamate--tRNA ligase [Cesiribacter andamanensis AMV16]
MENNIRVRFAPSPTGALHIGGVRTALYNYLFARKTGGTMVLRIEDTDQTRYVPGAEAYIQEALDWAGIQLDESPWTGGPYGPYRQSERKEQYLAYAQQLIEAGHAYYAFDTPEELEAMRERLWAARVANPQYDSLSRMQMKNSLTLSQEEVAARISSGEPYVIRFKMPRKEEVRLHDIIRGWVMVHTATLDDKVLMKSDGWPTYHLANVVDDYLMKITHVIRGEEWLPSAPLHVLLYKALGWEAHMPKFAHLPLILKPDGNGKLSKRDAEKQGFPIFPLEWIDPLSNEKVAGFREEGYLPEATVNFLAFLGWSPGTNDELFTMEELIEIFSLERIGKAGTKFDIDKAKWYNQYYLRKRPDAELAGMLQEQLDKLEVGYEAEMVHKVALEIKERAVFPKDLWKDGAVYFIRPARYDQDVAAKKWNAEAQNIISQFAQAVEDDAQALTAERAKDLLQQVLDKNNVKIGRVMQAVRLALTGVGSGPDLMNMIEIIGREETVLRLRQAVHHLHVTP